MAMSEGERYDVSRAALAAILAATTVHRDRPPAALGDPTPVEWLDTINREIDRTCQDSDGLFHPVVTDAAVRDCLARIAGHALLGIAALDRQAAGVAP